jgi:hypothetical protein
MLDLHGEILSAQEHQASAIMAIIEQYGLTSENHLWTHKGQLVVPLETDLLRRIVYHYHDTTTAGHPGVASTLLTIAKDYWWPKMKDFVHAYVKGCATCQMTKTNTHPNRPPLYPITPNPDAIPFSTISIDWVTKLPLSDNYNSILTITDHDCSKAVVLLPCKETMTSEDLARLYAE